MPSASSSLEPEIAKKPRQKKKDGGKKKAPAPVAPDHGKNEGADPHWAYQPPPGTVLLQDAADAGDFDWDEINANDDLELWLVRVPDSVKPKYIENMKVELPRSTQSARVGTLKRKHATFDVWAVGDGDDQPVGGEEIKGLSCLLPRRSKKGNLYAAPKPIARHLVLSAQPIEPTAETMTFQNPPRESHPKELLTHTFMPYGSVTGVGDVEDVEMVDLEVEKAPSSAQPPTIVEEKPPPDTKEVKKAKAKGKKRKGDEEPVTPAPKKSKKTKAQS